jgi:hypothetical protein
VTADLAQRQARVADTTYVERGDFGNFPPINRPTLGVAVHGHPVRPHARLDAMREGLMRLDDYLD